MRKLHLLLALLVPLSFLAQGIQFDETQQWKTILAKAKEQNKMLFVDAYTVWCGPCKQMSANVFPQKMAGDLFNKNFINVKLDMEKGEGIQFAKTYKVNSYPQLLFISPDGELVHYGVGSMPVESLVSLGKEALDPSLRIASPKTRFEAGTLDVEGKRKLAMIYASREPASLKPVAKQVLAEDKDWMKKENIMLMAQLMKNTDSEYFKYLWQNRAAIDVKFAEETRTNSGKSLSSYLEQLVVRDAFRKHPGYTKNATDSLAIRAYLGNYFPKNEIENQLAIAEVGRAMQWNNAKTLLAMSDKIERVKQQLSSSDLNIIAWTIFEKASTTTPEQLALATGWARLSVEKAEEYANTDTLAHLLAKTGNKTEAKKWAERSVELGKKAGEDVSSTEELLRSL